MRILFVSEWYSSQIHGPSRKLALITGHLRAHYPDVDFRVLTEDPRPHDSASIAVAHAVPRVWRPVSKLYRAWRFALEARRLHATFEYDIVVYNDAPMAWAAGLSPKPRAVPVAMLNDDNHVALTRRVDERWQRHFTRVLHGWVERFVCRRVAGVIVCSEYLRDAVVRAHLDGQRAAVNRLHVLHPAIDPSEWLLVGGAQRQMHARPNLTFVKSDAIRGGLLDLLAALEDESLRLKLGTITLAGFDPTQYAPRLRAVAGYRDLRVVGFLDRVALRDLLRNTDIGVVPSQHEAYGITVQEFAAAGCVVVASDAGGLPEACAGTAAITFRAGDRDALRDALEAAIQSSQDLSGLQAWTPTYGAAAMTRRFVGLLELIATTSAGEGG